MLGLPTNQPLNCRNNTDNHLISNAFAVKVKKRKEMAESESKLQNSNFMLFDPGILRNSDACASESELSGFLSDYWAAQLMVTWKRLRGIVGRVTLSAKSPPTLLCFQSNAPNPFLFKVSLHRIWFFLLLFYLHNLPYIVLEIYSLQLRRNWTQLWPTLRIIYFAWEKCLDI